MLSVPLLLLIAGVDRVCVIVALSAFLRHLKSHDVRRTLLQYFILGLSLNPGVVAKAYAGLNAVVGPGRMPDLNDAESLVYISAIVKGSLRWKTVVPFGVPHTTIFAQVALFIAVASVLNVYDIAVPLSMTTDALSRPPR